MPVRDIRAYKNCLRERYKKARRAMPPEVKADCDERIRNRVRGLDHYKTASTLLTFVSTAIEVDTHELIRQALAEDVYKRQRQNHPPLRWRCWISLPHRS